MPIADEELRKQWHREYSKGHYQRNKEKYKAKGKISRQVIKERNKKYIVDYLLSNPCVDCGESDIEVLQFDHKELVGNKAKRVGSYMGSSIENLQAEIDKCEVRCANCHVRRTRNQMGWFRSL